MGERLTKEQLDQIPDPKGDPYEAVNRGMRDAMQQTDDNESGGKLGSSGLRQQGKSYPSKASDKMSKGQVLVGLARR